MGKTKPFSQDAETPVIAARLERETYDRLKDMAQEQRRPLGSLIRNILEDFVAGQT
jgi:predicted DNA-binding protein